MFIIVSLIMSSQPGEGPSRGLLRNWLRTAAGQRELRWDTDTVTFSICSFMRAIHDAWYRLIGWWLTCRLWTEQSPQAQDFKAEYRLLLLLSSHARLSQAGPHGQLPTRHHTHESTSPAPGSGNIHTIHPHLVTVGHLASSLQPACWGQTCQRSLSAFTLFDSNLNRCLRKLLDIHHSPKFWNLVHKDLSDRQF